MLTFRRIIAALEIVEPDPSQVCEHADRVAEIAERGALVVIPHHRDLQQPEPVLAGYIQHFRIESKPLDALKLEGGQREPAAKGFESALSVFVGHPGDRPHQQVEHAAPEIAQERLMDAYEAPVDRPRSECDISLIVGDGVYKLRGLRYGRGEISIRKEHDFAEGFGHPAFNAVAFAPIGTVG